MQLKFKTNLLVAIFIVAAASVCQASDLLYILDVSVDTDKKRVSGTANISGSFSRPVSLNARNLSNIRVDGRKTSLSPNGSLVVEIGGKGAPTTIQYEADFTGTPSGLIDDAHVFLMSGWYPAPIELVQYTLSATLPRDFTAVSEAESASTAFSDDLVTHLFHFPHPLDALHLAASSRYVVKKDTFNGIAVEAYFFEEDKALADSYLEHTKQYLKYFESILTPYPYKRFAIVENILPTGYSMPTFTLLGRDVVRLPFIVKTSLPHEIVHQWFGNHVYIDDSRGNWAEGLATYLADHHMAEIRKKGSVYRKQILMNYDAYVHPGNAIPVSGFQYQQNKAQKTVGYGRSAMFFHGLKTRFGPELFYQSLNAFIRDNRFRPASWLDIQHAFEGNAGEELNAYFDIWLNRRGIPRLSVKKSAVEIQGGRPVITFSLAQPGEPFPLDIPVQIHTRTCIKKKIVRMNEALQDFVIQVEEIPEKVVLDEGYDLMRHLAGTEKPPILAGVMGRQKWVLAVADKMKPLYEPLAPALGVEDMQTADPENIDFATVGDNTLIVCGHDNPLAKALLGSPPVPDAGLGLTLFKHPYNNEEQILLVHAANRQEVLAVKRKLRHYGKYSELLFQQGKVTRKHIVEADNGIPVIEHEEVLALQPGKVPTLDQIRDRLLKTRVVFAGEKHDRYAHHMNQLDIIRHIHDSGADVAVGLEMFHQPYQHVIDDYLAGRIDERTFLKQSHYYKEWRYDYGLYKSIVDFCKETYIPLIALNIPGDISKKVAREGIDSLSDGQKKMLPQTLDFSNQDYRTDLKTIFSLHTKQHGLDNFNHFFQAQVLWDESMAERASRFLDENPNHKLVILAGNGHIRHGHGIPDRLFRRSGASYTIVLQDEAIEEEIADYVLLTTEIKGERSPKLGVAVEQADTGLTITGVRKKSPAEKAGLEKGDVIQMFDGQTVADLADLKIALYYSRTNRQYTINILRDGQVLDMDITLSRSNHFSMHGDR